MNTNINKNWKQLIDSPEQNTKDISLLAKGFSGIQKSKPVESLCEGMVFRCKVRRFLTKTKEYTEQVWMTPLKRKSCPGCAKCGYFADYLDEFCDPLYDNNPILPTDPQDKGLYTLAIVNESKDWESGLVDDFDLEFLPYTEPTKKD